MSRAVTPRQTVNDQTDSGGMMPVKKLIAVIVAVAFVAGLSGYAVAQTTQPAPKMEPKQDKMAGEKKAEKRMSAKNANGTVKSASADSVVVAGREKNKDMEGTVAVGPKNKIKKDRKDVGTGQPQARDT